VFLPTFLKNFITRRAAFEMGSFGAGEGTAVPLLAPVPGTPRIKRFCRSDQKHGYLVDDVCLKPVFSVAFAASWPVEEDSADELNGRFEDADGAELPDILYAVAQLKCRNAWLEPNSDGTAHSGNFADVGPR
jgi:hypothetical protein